MGLYIDTDPNFVRLRYNSFIEINFIYTKQEFLSRTDVIYDLTMGLLIPRAKVKISKIENKASGNTPNSSTLLLK